MEHVYPDWLSKHFPKSLMGINEISGDGSPRSWPEAVFQHKAKIVCADCNNGWMSDIETNAQPILKNLILTHDSAVLDKQAQQKVAVWAQKTVLVLNRATGGSFKIPANFYTDLYDKQAPINSISVTVGWRLQAKGNKAEPLATFEIKQISNVNVDKASVKAIKADIDAGRLGWSATIGLGKVVFHVFGHNLNGSMELVNNDYRVLAPINPYASDLSWPLEWPIEALGGLEAAREQLHG